MTTYGIIDRPGALSRLPCESSALELKGSWIGWLTLSDGQRPDGHCI